jgi:hypothetical protein
MIHLDGLLSLPELTHAGKNDAAVAAFSATPKNQHASLCALSDPLSGRTALSGDTCQLPLSLTSLFSC